MAKIVDHNLMREKLINGAIRVITREGLEGCTTKAISKESGLNESYIYRYYLDRDDLIQKAFLTDEEKLFEVFIKALENFKKDEKDWKDKLADFGNEILDFYFSDVTYGIFYCRIYFSVFFKDKLLNEHYKYANIFKKELEKIFIIEDAAYLLHTLFNQSLDYVLLTSRNIITDSPENRNRIFCFAYETCKNFVKTI